MPTAVVLLSGGLDSYTAAAVARRDGFDVCALSFRYGQRHRQEIEAASRVARSVGVTRHLVLDLDLTAIGGSSLTSNDMAVPKDRDVDATDIPSTYVPARNTIFLSVALGWAEVLGASDIFIGVNALDYSGYPDCRPEFIYAFEQLARVATRAGVEGHGLTVHTPLMMLSKADIIRLGLELGLDYGLTLSCYDPAPDGTPCGHCDSCQLRMAGFAAAGVADPALLPGSALTMARPLRQQLLVVAAALILAVLAALFYASRLTHDEQVSQLQDEALAMTSTVVAYLERTLESADDVAAVAARHPLVQQLGPRAATEVLEPLLGRADQVLRNAVIADTTGRPVAWATPPAPTIEGQVSTAWLASVASSGTPAISPVLGGPDHDAHVVLMAYPVADSNQKTVGVLALAVHLEALEKVFANIPLPRDSVITVTDEQSVVVARSLDSARYVGRSTEGATGSPRPLRSIPRTDIRTGVDGVERVYGNAVVERGPWLASVGIPILEASERTAPIDSRNSIIMLGSLLFILGLSLLVSNGWVAALQEVGRTAERVAKGDLSPKQPKDVGSLELNQLDQSITGMINHLRDAQEAVAAQVSEERRVREEKESLQRQLIRQERLAAIGVLVSGVAHELNNPLQAILGFAELLNLHENLPDDVRHDLSLIRRESTRASAIIRNLQRFGRQTSAPSPVKLSDVVGSVLELRQRKIEAQDIRLDIEDQSDAVVSAVFTELQQVVLNFLINAEQAVLPLEDSRRRVKIRTSDARNSARLEVEDYGDGVPPADEAKLFQPFFTTKPVGEGTGLGLSVSYGIITSHGGEIGYRRSHTGGAIFYFELPTK